MSDLFYEETFRPAFGRVLAGALMTICALAGLSVVGAGADALWQVWPWLALVAFGAWALYWRPEVEVNAGGVRVVNVFRTLDVPWPAITDIETKWALTLVTTLGTVRAWAAPAPGRQVLRRSQAEDLRLGGAGKGDMVRPSDLPQTESGAAALVVRQRWLRIREAGFLADPRVEHDRMPVRWHVETIAGFALLTVAVVYGTFLR
ncbi:MAG: PH domain-containing protein [Ilumatobacter fluminis]